MLVIVSCWYQRHAHPHIQVKNIIYYVRTYFIGSLLVLKMVYLQNTRVFFHFFVLFQLTCCPNSDMLKQWRPQPVSRAQVQEMRVSLGVLMPPWERKMFLNIHIDPNVPLPVTRDFVALLQKNAPELS